MFDVGSQLAPRAPNDKCPSKLKLKTEVRRQNWVELTEIHFVNHASQRRRGYVAPQLNRRLGFCKPWPAIRNNPIEHAMTERYYISATA